MFLTLRKILFKIVNQSIALSNTEAKKARGSLSLSPIVGLKQTKTGVMILNKPEDNNNVTLQCADQLFRFLNTYHHDHTVESIWLQNRGPSFSGGIDMDTLINDPDYLDKIFRLSIMMGQFNKPIFAKVNGGVRGLGAYMLTMLSTPLGTEKSTLRLDQTSKGFIPIFGGSHRLSRLPANIGIYLALTGDRLDFDQMNRIGFLRGKVRDEHTRSQITKHLSDANLFMKNPYTPSSHSLSAARKQNFILRKRNYFYDLLSEVQKETYKNSNNFVGNFALNQYRLAKTQYHNTINPFNSFSQNQAVANNYFEMRHDRAYDYLKSKGIIEDGRTHNNIIARLPIDKLMRVFSRNTMQQVMEELKNDQSDWARKTEQLIRNKDPLAVHLTFHLLKQTKQLNWVDCLEKQYTLARKILKVSKLGNKDTPKGGSFLVLQNQYSSMQIQQIGNDIVQEFLKPASDESEIFDHDTPKYSMMPTSDYWREIPDAGRNYLNRTFFEDYHSKFADIETVRFLNANKIDYRDSSYNIPTLRQYLYKNIDYGRLLEAEKQRIRGILKSDSIYNKTRQNRKIYLKKILQNTAEVEKLIAQQIQLYFQEKFNHRFDDLKKTADIAGKESRMSIFRNYIKTLTQNIVYKGREIEDSHRENNARHLGIVRIDNQGRDVFTAQNQYQQQIPGYDKVKQAYFHRDPKRLEQIDPQMAKPKNIVFSSQLLPDEQEFLRQDQALKRNYNDSTLIPRRMALNYRTMMQKASKTSQQLTQLLGWQNSDIQAMIINSDKKDITLKEFSEQMIKNAPSIEEKVNQLNILYQHHMKLKQHVIGDAIKETKNRDHVKDLFFDTSVIPRQFRQLHLSLLGQVIDFYSQKYRIGEALTTVNVKQLKNNLISKWAEDSVQQSFSEFMKNDVEYTFSYLVVLHLKSILRQIQQRNIRNSKKMLQFLNDQYGINFEGYPPQKFSSYFMNYLYRALDMHQQSKHRIILPQTKMIQFIKQFKSNRNFQKKSQALNYQTLVFLIGKDRKMIRDYQNGVVPILGYHPQLNLNTLVTEADEANHIQKIPRKLMFSKAEKSVMSREGDFKQISPLLKLQQLNSGRTNIQQKKQLVFGFTHYLRRFEAMIQQIAGTSMFLPKRLYQLEVKKIYEEAKNLLKVQLSDEQWFKSKLRSAVRTILDFRLEKEKQMGQGELRMFDRQFFYFLAPDCLELVIDYQDSTEEAIARSLVNETKKEASSNDDIKSNYLDIKQHIKNPRALRLFNNLILSQEIINERTLEAQSVGNYSQYSINQQRNDLSGQRSRKIYSRTYERLMSSAFQYSDEQQGHSNKNVKHVRKALGKTLQQTNKVFLPEIEQIMKLLDDQDLKEELDDRVRRIKIIKNE